MFLLATATIPLSSTSLEAQQSPMMIRIAELEIAAPHLDAYRAILKEEAEASIRLEAGVLAIFPMYSDEDPTQLRILEIYASRAAYESHLKSPHFLRYKSSTEAMVKSLKLVEMRAVDTETMSHIFRKVP